MIQRAQKTGVYSQSIHGRDLPRAVLRSGITLADILSMELANTGNTPTTNRSFTPFIDLRPPSPRVLNVNGTPSAELLFDSVRDRNLNKTKQLLQNPLDLAVNYHQNGYTALELAVVLQEVEIFNEILNHPNVDVDHALVLAVAMGCSNMVEEILMKVHDCDINQNVVEGENSERFTSLVLLALTEATRQDKWAVVDALLQEPYRLSHLQNLDYGETEEGMRRVELVLRRITEYQIVCSPVYLALDKEDPILTAFIYSRNLRYWGDCFSAFKWQFEALADQVDQFAVDLLSQCRNSEEVELILQAPKDEHGEINKNHTWSRLSLAVSFQQQMFVSNPLCQHVVHNTWIGGLSLMNMCHLNNVTRHWWSLTKFILFFSVLTVLYPLLPLIYLCCSEESSLVKKTRVPCVKLICELIAYLWFLGLVLADTFLGHDKFQGKYRYLDYMIVVWIVAMLVQKLHLYNRVRKYFFVFWVNLYDVFMGLLYILIFTLEHGQDIYGYFIKMTTTSGSREKPSLYLDPEPKVVATCHSRPGLLPETCRIHRAWTHYILVAEACSAIFSMLACLRLLYLFQITSFFGPLQVSLVKMIKDILRFFVLFTIVLLSFAVGLYKLYSSYKGGVVVEDGTRIVQDETFVSFSGTIQALFWSLFGMVDLKVANMVVGQYNMTLADNTTQLVTVDHYINEALGYMLWGTYHLVAILVLLNVLIAMMNESFVRVQNNADAEWKFARTQVYLLYIEPGGMLPPPFNLLQCPLLLIRLFHQAVKHLLRPPRQPHKPCPNLSVASKERYEILDSKYLDFMKVLVGRYRKLHEQKVKAAEAVNTVASPLLSACAPSRAYNSRSRKLSRKKSCCSMDFDVDYASPKLSLGVDVLLPRGSVSSPQ